MLIDLKTDMKQFTFHVMLETTDISDVFPLEDAENLNKFLAQDEDWPKRKRSFSHLLFNTLSKKPRKFASALLHTLFSRTFIQNHKWPSPGYFYSFFLIML